MSERAPMADARPDAAALRRVLGSFVTGVTVVTTRDADGVPHGFTANSFTSVSLDPPLVLVCVGHAVEGLEVYRECRLVRGQHPRRFPAGHLGDLRDGTSGNGLPESAGGKGPCGSPILEGCVASLECISGQRIEAGDHMILIGRVVAGEHSDRRPLVFCRGGYSEPAARERRRPCARTSGPRRPER